MENITLQQILEAFCAPINEEQAWAVCYQCARNLQSSAPQLIQATDGKAVPASSSKLPKVDQVGTKHSIHVFSLADVALSSDGNVVVTINKTGTFLGGICREKEYDK